MIPWKTVIIVWLVIYGNCDPTTAAGGTDEAPPTASNGTSTSDLVTELSTKATSETTETLVNSTDSFSTPSDKTDSALANVTTTESIADEVKNTTQEGIDTNGDIILTAESSSTTDESSTKKTETPTVFGDDETTTMTELPTTEGPIETACSSSPCVNGGNCTANFTTPSLFECTCPSGYEGLRCEVINKCVESENGTLCKNGACVSSDDGLIRFCDCFYGMSWDEDEMECRDPDPPCFPNPCHNGGTCSVQEGKVICECPPDYEKNCTVHNTCGDCQMGNCVLDSSGTTRYCECNSGLYWNEEDKKCETESLPCLPNPCENGGTCALFKNGTFNCSCTEGFSGATCEVIEKCSADQDCIRGICTLTEDETTRMCHCANGYYLEEQSHTCQEIVQPCEPNPCSHGGICIPSSEGAFICLCPDGYAGKTCTVRDMCVMDGGKAFCGDANCTSVQDLEVYYCSCGENQYFDYTQRKCLDLDLCSLKRCAATEECVKGNCECKQNYHFNDDNGLCEPKFCLTNPCPAPGMICEEGSGSTDYQCHCKDGEAFNGTHCNEVSCIFPQMNGCDQSCTVTSDGYKCGCEEGFQLNEDNHTCTYNGSDACTNTTCDGGSCVEKNGTKTCICPAGYIEDKGKCVDICGAGRMMIGICPDDKCETVEGKGFKCKCEGKYDFSKDETTCMVRNVCGKNQIGSKTCSERNAMCFPDWSADSGFKCKCQKGQIEVGGICRDICSIASNQHHCSSKGAICDSDGDGNMICRCTPYFKMNSADDSCSKPADHSYFLTLSMDEEAYMMENRQKRSFEINSRKILFDASAMAREMFYGFSEAKIVSCKSEPGWFIFCKLELQFQTVQEADLKRLKIRDVCVTVDSSNRCILPPSLVLAKDRFSKDVAIQQTDPCDDDIKIEVCGSETTCTSHPQTTRNFNCSCKVGFLPRRRIYPFAGTKSFIETCRDVDECMEDDPCIVNSDCINTIGSYLCTCKRGFRSVEDPSYPDGKKCVDICNPNPCTHGQCSTREDHEFDCTCDAGYRGTFCNLQDQNYKEMKINTVIVGVVLGGVLLITIILFIACISRLRKKKSLEESGNVYYSSTEMHERRRVEGGGVVNNAFRRE